MNFQYPPNNYVQSIMFVRLVCEIVASTTEIARYLHGLGERQDFVLSSIFLYSRQSPRWLRTKIPIPNMVDKVHVHCKMIYIYINVDDST